MSSEVGCPIAIKRDVLEFLQVKTWIVFLSNSFQEELFCKGPGFLGPPQVLVWPAGTRQDHRPGPVGTTQGWLGRVRAALS